MDQLNLEEKLVYGTLVSTYPLFFLGGLYLSGPAVCWLLLGLYTVRVYFKQAGSPGWLGWAWLAAALALLVTLFVGHANQESGLITTLKSAVGWAKGWALFAIALVAGYTLDIRRQVLSRSAYWIGVHTLVFCVLSVLAVPLGMDYLYTSPLKVLGGAGTQFFEVAFFGINPETGLPRWRFFTPWAPAAALLAATFLVMVWPLDNPRHKWVAVTGFFAMALLCQSRMGWVVLPTLLLLLASRKLMLSHHSWLAAGAFLGAFLFVGAQLFDFVLQIYADIRSARPDSTRVRSMLAELAIQRWQNEAFWFGHGTVENGPALVANMPIGSHHTWLGLLFVKGLAGALIFAAALTATLIALMRYYNNHTIWPALCMMLPIGFYTFTENLEILAYLLWPAFLFVGITLRDAKNTNNGERHA